MTGSRYNRADAEAALAAAGVGAGDTVLVHVGLMELGLPRGLQPGQTPAHPLLEALRSAVGPTGTVLTPTFTYSFCRGETYDPATSPSSVGPFGNVVLADAGRRRSHDPLFSLAGWGPAIDSLFAGLPPTAFGNDSAFARLVATNARLVMAGVGFHAATVMHHFEFVAGVPYRYPKRFYGRRMIDGVADDCHWEYLVRIMADFSLSNFDAVEQAARSSGIMRAASLGRGTVLGVGLQDLQSCTRKVLAADPLALIRGPAPDPTTMAALIASEQTEAGA